MTEESKIRKNNPYIYNSWRSIRFTEKGRKAGNSEEWNTFINFFNDVKGSYNKGLKLARLDKSKPFSKDNFIWVTPDEAVLLKDNLVKLTYNGETLYLSELAEKYNQSLSGIRKRYHTHKSTYTVEEIIFGKRKGSKRPTIDIKELDSNYLKRVKASKMVSAYRVNDKKKGWVCDLTIEDMLEIMSKPCIYCGDINRIGCDRIDNNKGHTKDNVVPCCVDCNKARNDNFTFEEMKILGKAIREIKLSRIV